MTNKKYIVIIAGIVVAIGLFAGILFILSGRNKQVPPFVPRISTYDVPTIKESQEIEEATIEGIPSTVVSKSLIIRFEDDITKEQSQAVINKLGVLEAFNIAQHIWEIRYGDSVDLAEKINEIEPIQEIKTVGYNGVYKLQYKPNDYTPQGSNSESWWLENVNAKTAWDITHGDSNVIVAVFDQPADFVAPDLAGKGSQIIWPTPTPAIPYTPTPTLSATTTLTPAVSTPTPAVLPGADHGSHVSGIVGAHTDNGIGVASIGFNTRLLSFPVCVPLCEFSNMIASFQEVIDRVNAGENIKVINQSYAGPTEDTNIHDMIKLVVEKGVVPVAAVGNDFGDVMRDENDNPVLDGNGDQIPVSYMPHYPAAHSEVIAVAASNSTNQLSSFSQRNDPSSAAQLNQWVDVAAPGVDIVSTFPDGSYVSWSGTSMASPLVAGIVALCGGVNPNLSAEEIINIVKTTAQEKPLTSVTYGKVDAEKIVRACKDPANYVAEPSNQVCNSWGASAVLPGIQGNRTHPAPSFALENRYYVIGQDLKAWYANQQGDGSLGPWVEAGFDSTAAHGYTVAVAQNHAYMFRNGHLMDVHDGGGQTVVADTLESGMGDPYSGIYFVWDTAVTATFGSKQVIYHLGGYDSPALHKGYTQDIHSAEVPPGGFTQGTRFNRLSQKTPTGGSSTDGSGAQYKAAYIAGNDDSYGFIYMGQAGQSSLWRIKAKNDGSLEGSWQQVEDLPGGTGNQRGDMLSYENYLYSIRGSKFARRQVNKTNGEFIGGWESLASLPSAQLDSSFVWGGNHPEGASYGIMNGYLYVTSDQYVYYISLTGQCDTLPVPTQAPQAGSGTQGGAVGESISCVIPEWVIRGPDVVVPPITCKNANIEVANPAYVPPAPAGQTGSTTQASLAGGVRCDECASAYVFPQPIFSPKGPTNQDVGQKDGTGQYGTDRLYYYYDYEQGLIINVPPFGFGVGGPAPIVGQPDINSPYSVPCGWPSPDQNRVLTLGCDSPDPLDAAGKICPNGAAAGSWCGVQGSIQNGQHAGYNAMDIAGEFAIQSTMDGMAYRCVDLKSQSIGSGSYGTYVVVVGQDFRTLYSHMRVEPKDSNANGLPSGSECVYGAAFGETERYPVKRGDVIGYVGTTGDSTGNHLHYEIRSSTGLLCPAAYIDQTHPYCQPGATVQNNGVAARVQSFLQSINPFKTNDTVVSDYPGDPAP